MDHCRAAFDCGGVRRQAVLLVALSIACGDDSGASTDLGGDGSTSHVTSGSSSGIGDDSTTGATEETSEAATTDGESSGLDSTDDDDTTDNGDSENTSDGGPDPVDIDPRGALFVRPDGQDSNPGTMDEPLRTIQWALGQAEDDPEVDTIYVAAGEYTTQFADNDHIELVDGVSLFGGYSEDWSQRDVESFASTISDVSDGPGAASPHRTVDVPNDVGPATVFDGFTITMNQPDGSIAGIVVYGDATISNNRIIAGDLVDGGIIGTVYGMYVGGGAARIDGNSIELQLDNTWAAGLRFLYFDGVAANNEVHVDIGTSIAATDVVGIHGDAIGTGLMLHNSVRVEHGYALRLPGGSDALFVNNVFEAGDDEHGCVWIPSAIPIPSHGASFASNAFHCPTIVTVRQDSNTLVQNTATSIQELESLFGASTDNVSLDMALFDGTGDFALDPSEPCSVSRGGSPLPEVTADRVLLPRTDPVSLGAHEWDGDCL